MEGLNNQKNFLPDERTAMVTDEEVTKILQLSLGYIIALVDFNVINTRFQIIHNIVIGFKTELGKSFKNNLSNEANWEELIEPDQSLQERLIIVRNRIDGVQSSLMEVERLQRKL